jgi:hypothetical protein
MRMVRRRFGMAIGCGQSCRDGSHDDCQRWQNYYTLRFSPRHVKTHRSIVGKRHLLSDTFDYQDMNRPPDGSSLHPGQSVTGLCPVDLFDDQPLYCAPQNTPGPAEIAACRRPLGSRITSRSAPSRHDCGRRTGPGPCGMPSPSDRCCHAFSRAS